MGWKCKSCDDKTKNATANIDILLNNITVSSPPPKFGRGIRIGHINIRDVMSKSKLNDVKVL
jgi:hypothetical protein